MRFRQVSLFGIQIIHTLTCRRVSGYSLPFIPVLEEAAAAAGAATVEADA